MFSGLARYMNPPAKKNGSYYPTKEENFANCLTHGILIIPSMFAFYSMYTLSRSTFHTIVSFVYGINLVSLFFISTTYHILQFLGKFKKLENMFHIWDHIIIYLFIAASYMPWLLLQDNGGFGDDIAWILWTATIAGVIYSYFFHEQYKMLDTILYVCIGVIPSIPLMFLAEKSLAKVALGGAIYIAGVPFFKLDGRVPFAHAIWHLFVAAAAAIHFNDALNQLYIV